MNNSKAISVNKSLIILILGIVAGSLVLFSTIGQLIIQPTHPEHVQGLFTFFNSTAEGNLPTYYSSFILLVAALLLFIITLRERESKSKYVSYWAVLTFGFMYLSMDEMLTLHENISLFIRSVTNYNGQGVLKSPWVILGAIAVMVILLVFIKFIFHLNRKTRFIFLAAGILYVGSAIGFEIVENLYAEVQGQGLIYSMMQNLEEGLEMAGIIVFISGLLGYIGDNFRTLQFDFYDENGKQLPVIPGGPV